MEKKRTCTVPIRAKYTVDRKTGEIINREFEMAEIPTNALAEFLLQRFGIDAEVKENGETR